MSVVKTAISMQESLFQEMEKLAAELEISRSRLLTLALEEFIERRENLNLLAALNAAYKDDEQAEELMLAERHLVNYREQSVDSW